EAAAPAVGRLGWAVLPGSVRRRGAGGRGPRRRRLARRGGQPPERAGRFAAECGRDGTRNRISLARRVADRQGQPRPGRDDADAGSEWPTADPVRQGGWELPLGERPASAVRAGASGQAGPADGPVGRWRGAALRRADGRPVLATDRRRGRTTACVAQVSQNRTYD